MLKKFANIDVQAWYPAHQSTPDAAKDWTYDTQLKMAEASFKAGFPIGFGCGSNSTDANQTWGATFGAFGADLVDAKGNITVESDNVMQVHGIHREDGEVHAVRRGELGRCLEQPRADLRQGGVRSGTRPRPGRWPSAMRRDVAADCWTFPNPLGPKGRLVPHRPYFWGVWSFAQNKTAAKEIIE